MKSVSSMAQWNLSSLMILVAVPFCLGYIDDKVMCSIKCYIFLSLGT